MRDDLLLIRKGALREIERIVREHLPGKEAEALAEIRRIAHERAGEGAGAPSPEIGDPWLP